MASRYAEYRTSEDNCSDDSDFIVISDDDDDDDTVVPRRVRRKNNVILESEESEEEPDRIPFHSTLISGHVFPSSDKLSGDREKRISEIEEQNTLSANSDSEQDIFHSDEETVQKSYIKSRKSTRISLALGKLLTIDNEAMSDACQKSVCSAKGTLKDTSIAKSSDEDSLQKVKDKRHDSGTFVSSNDSEGEKEGLVKNGSDKNLTGTEKINVFGKKKTSVNRHSDSVARFSSDGSESENECVVKNRSEETVQCLEEGENGRCKNKKILVQKHDGTVAHFSSDESNSESIVKNRSEENLQCLEGGENGRFTNKESPEQKHDDDSENENIEKNRNDSKKEIHNTEENSGFRNKIFPVQRHDNSVEVFSSDKNEIDKFEENGRSQKVHKNEETRLEQNQPMQLNISEGIVYISDESEKDNNNWDKMCVHKETLKPINRIENNDCLESGSKIGDNTQFKQNIKSEIQVLKIVNRLDKSKVSHIRTYLTVEKPQVTQFYIQLKSEIDVLTRDIAKLKNVLKCVDIRQLPDNGMKLQMKLQESINMLKLKERELKNLPEDCTNVEIPQKSDKPVTSRLPIGLGVKALQSQIREKTLTEEALSDLHGSINTCPSENVLADAPLGLKTSVELMVHQRHALAWLSWRETQKPSAGILADDMGLGKTLTMISLILKTKEEDDGKPDNKENEEEFEEDSSGYPVGGSLVVCPASLLLQWEDEIKKHCKRSVLEVEIHHGSGREENARRLSQKDVVITTYSIVRTSANKGGKGESVKRSKRGVLHRIRWSRIILDEAHVVRNHKSQQSLAVCLLMGRKRWALTGTPIHNKELDLYALLKFLRCSPFDDYNVWRRWVDNKNSAGIKRLNTVINAIMLRRTKAVLQDKGELPSLPEKNLQEIYIKLEKDEFEVYTKILWFSKTLFAQYLQQRADKEMSELPRFCQYKNTNDPFANNPELAKMFSKMQQMHDIKTHEILVLLLRLRQICVHPGLIKSMLDEEAKQSGGIEEANEVDSDILSKMGAMSLEDPLLRDQDGDAMEEVLHQRNPVFDLTRVSSKMKAVFKVLNEKVLNTSDKGIIVSQWTSTLNILHNHLVDFGVKCDMLSGAVPVKDRMDIVKRFNSEWGSRVLLLSLTAGGVGLNLTGGNHLMLMDLHWNPQLESQAFDRIYRVGQKKPVYIYKFICQETIEERIKLLQDKKLSLANSVLSGTMQRNGNKLTLEDLKSLFSM